MSCRTGQSSRLDKELNRLKESVRNEVAPEQLEPLGQSIAEAVLEIDRSAAPAPRVVGEARMEAITDEGRIRNLLSQLLTEAGRDGQLVMAADALKQELVEVLVPDQLSELIERVGVLVMRRIQGLEHTRQELEQLLGHLVSQLDSLGRHVEGAASDESERNSSSETLNLQITGEVQALGESVANGSDLELVRHQLGQRLDAITRHLTHFHQREAERTRQVQQRTEQMRGRMEEMESEARRLKAKLTDEKRLSMLDPLTHVPNRLAYEQRMAEELERWARFSQPTCVAVWDIDQFKAINDQYGHRAGDKVLTVVADCLANAIRSTDFLARYGGEEFVMLLPGTTLPDALRLANEMREAITQLGFHFRGTPVSITISGGRHGIEGRRRAEEAFDRADSAMYQAKESGRNRIVSA